MLREMHRVTYQLYYLKFVWLQPSLLHQYQINGWTFSLKQTFLNFFLFFKLKSNGENVNIVRHKN